MTGLMNSRTLKNFVLSQSVHCQDPKNETSLGIFELDLLSQMMELLVSQEAADTNFKPSLTYELRANTPKVCGLQAFERGFRASRKQCQSL
jgi:hypothetical protein